MAGREGNTLSAVLRQGWDSGNLRVLTKNSAARATGAHISIIGHITKDELLRELDSIEAGNGFGNRFLIMVAQRARVLPDGGWPHRESLEELSARLTEALEFASTAGRMDRDEAAREMWHAVYPALSADRPGLSGSLTARAEAQVLRLSMVYALMDFSTKIRAEHLEAALAMWERCEASVKFIFGDQTGDRVADPILRALRIQGSLTQTEIRDLLGRHDLLRLPRLLRTQSQRRTRREPGGWVTTSTLRSRRGPAA